MKKILSIVLSALMAFSACSATALVANANVISPGGETNIFEIGTTVNGDISADIIYSQNEDNSYEITFTYIGNGTLEGWEFIPNDVTIILQEGNSITILVNASVTKLSVNAIVKDAPTPTEPVKPEPESPETGALTMSSIAITGAGIAALALLKKKNDEE